MAKMYYTETETAGKLGVDHAGLMKMVKDGKLRAYADGTSKMFKVAEVDAITGSSAADTAQASDIQLSPADLSGTHETMSLSGTHEPMNLSGTHQPISLSDTEEKSGTSADDTSKSDTVITSEGISIFDDEDLEIEPADPMAKTQIAPGLDENISLEGAAGGSGLLDLTRESDDTSLGAEVLDHIDMETGDAIATVESAGDGIDAVAHEDSPMYVEAVPLRTDPAAPAFGAIAGVGMVLALLLGALAVAALTGTRPAYVRTLGENLLAVAGGAVVLVVVAAVIGMVIGKKAAQPASSEV